MTHRRRLQFAAHVAPPEELSLARQAAAFDLEPVWVERSRAARIAVVQFDANHRISGLEWEDAGNARLRENNSAA